jgi:hypothetical protein
MEENMKKAIVTLLVLSFVLAGVSLAAADNLPKSLKGVDLKAAQKVTDNQAQVVRGAAIMDRDMLKLQDGTGSNCTTPTCVPKLYLAPGPHK